MLKVWLSFLGGQSVDLHICFDKRMHYIFSAEKQKGVNIVQQCSTENQKGGITIDFEQR